MSNVKGFLEAIKGLGANAPNVPIQLASPAAQEALSNLNVRISQFEENLTNPLPAYLFDGQTAILKDLKKKRDALISGAISIETAMSVQPLSEAEAATDDLPTEVLSTAIATMPTVEEPTDVEGPADSESSIAAPEVPNPQIDTVLIAALVTRIRAIVLEQVVSEAAKLVLEFRKAAVAEALIQLKTELQNHGE